MTPQEIEVQIEFLKDSFIRLATSVDKIADKVLSLEELNKIKVIQETRKDIPKLKQRIGIPKEDWGVHETHCCNKHGCKYGDHDDCPVEQDLTKGLYQCESCRWEEEDYFRNKLPLKPDFHSIFEKHRNKSDVDWKGEVNWDSLEEEVWEFIKKKF